VRNKQQRKKAILLGRASQEEGIHVALIGRQMCEQKMKYLNQYL
jgi:hypothetical protein